MDSGDGGEAGSAAGPAFPEHLGQMDGARWGLGDSAAWECHLSARNPSAGGLGGGLREGGWVRGRVRG